MTTMEADPNTSRLAAMRGSLTGAEWTRVAVMVGVIVALHLFGSLPLSSHTFIEASAHTMASSPTASGFEYLDLAGAVLTEPLVPNKGKVVPRGPGLGLEWDEKAVHKYALE
jgi:L-alanine-DL-glutamate epimerase-like enolase superfamily enzyme